MEKRISADDGLSRERPPEVDAAHDGGERIAAEETLLNRGDDEKGASPQDGEPQRLRAGQARWGKAQPSAEGELGDEERERGEAESSADEEMTHAVRAGEVVARETPALKEGHDGGGADERKKRNQLGHEDGIRRAIDGVADQADSVEDRADEVAEDVVVDQ